MRSHPRHERYSAIMRTSNWVLLTASRRICTLSTASLNYNINGHIRNGSINDARQLFDENPTARGVVSGTQSSADTSGTTKCNMLTTCLIKCLRENFVSWNAMLSGFHQVENPVGVYQCFLQMSRVGQTPNESTFATVISSFLNVTFNVLIPQLHGLIMCLGLNSSVFVGSALMRGYTHLENREFMCRVFDEILVKDVTTWNAFILGYMDLGLTVEAQRAFEMMPEKNIISWTTLVNGYITNWKLDKARSVFDEISNRNVVSWTAMIKGYVQHGRFLDALELFSVMLDSGTPPNHFTFSSVLGACAGCSSILVGSQVHSCILKSGIPLDVILLTSLIDIHGLATTALDEFESMTEGGVKPDHVTFINVLSACAHGGLVEEGQLEKAEKLIEGMPFKPDEVVWGALLGACGLHSSLAVGEFATRGLQDLEQDHPAVYSMLSKIHGEKGIWSNVTEIRKMMKASRAKKQKAGSWIESASDVS
ncbi:hypothetical protein RJ640_021710 [Escallonia rubra]|uniref:Pentatricopeptide repeat-containing protein n=1 Tax=Escallonia rubra TaxID=112253 RepID=A0AA88QV61_9ASTE|nr:hypothetical protein RJ640_021710 [Escallonia rubra]